MRSFYTATLLGILIIGTFPFQAHAVGNVLVPSNNGNNSSGGNLGLVPNNNSPSSPAPASPAPPPPTSTTPLPYTPAPQPTPTPKTNMPMPLPIPVPGNGTQVLKFPAMPPPPSNPSGTNLPNSINIVVDDKWNSSALTRVSDQFGIPVDKVSTTCQEIFMGIIMTDTGGSPFYANTSSHSTVRYSGKIKSIVLAPTSFCNVAYPLPRNKGVIFQSGDKYFLNLDGANCQLSSTAKAPSKISIFGGKDGSLQCQFQ